MKRCMAASALWLLSVAFAFAHSPYFTNSQPVRLPDGTLGEVRLLHGDGIMTADPARIVLFDSTGRLLAKSHRSTGLTLLCVPARQSCKGYDRNSREVIDFDPSRFRSEGPLVSTMGDRSDNDPIWAVEADPESWGFVQRPAELSQILTGLLDELRHPLVVFGGAMVALAWLAANSTFRYCRAVATSRSLIARAVIMPLICLVVGTALLAFLAAALLVLDSWPIILASIVLGSCLPRRSNGSLLGRDSVSHES